MAIYPYPFVVLSSYGRSFFKTQETRYVVLHTDNNYYLIVGDAALNTYAANRGHLSSVYINDYAERLNDEEVEALGQSRYCPFNGIEYDAN